MPRLLSPDYSNSSYVTIPESDTEQNKKSCLRCDDIFSNVAVLAPFTIFITISGATLFYKLHHNWDISTCIYYSCQAVIGVVYGVPEETDQASKIFTMILYLLGTTIIYAVIAEYTNIIVERAMKSANDISRMETVQDLNGDGRISRYEWAVFTATKLSSH
jgi:hypothetical protein